MNKTVLFNELVDHRSKIHLLGKHLFDPREYHIEMSMDIRKGIDPVPYFTWDYYRGRYVVNPELLKKLQYFFQATDNNSHSNLIKRFFSDIQLSDTRQSHTQSSS